MIGEFRFFIFDMIAKDGSFLLDQSLASRRKMLEEGFDRSGPLEFMKLVECKKIPVDTNLMPRLKEEFNSAKKKGYEGLIVKLARSPYLVRSRRNWFKLKFFEKSGKETLDLVIVGAQKGRGALEGTYGSLVCAVRDSNDKLFPVTKLSLAMSAPERAKLTEKIDALRVDFSAPGVENLSADFYLKPELVFEVAFDCFSLSHEYSVGQGVVDEKKGISLRFPVIIRQREDKGVKDATTVDELITQFQALQGESGQSTESMSNEVKNKTEGSN